MTKPSTTETGVSGGAFEDTYNVRPALANKPATSPEPSKDASTSEDETTTTAEETADETNNEHEASDTQEDNSSNEEAEGEGDPESSRVIAQLGEDRKKLAAQLIDMAKSGDSALEQVKEFLTKDPSMDKYIRTKFGSDYDVLFKGEDSKESDRSTVQLTPEEIEEQKALLKTQVKLEIIAEENKRIKQAEIEDFAAKKKFSPEERDQLVQYVTALEQTVEYSQELLTKAGTMVNPTKVLTKNKSNSAELSGGDGGGNARAENADKKKNTITVTPVIESMANRLGKDPVKYAESLAKIRSGRGKDGTFTLKL